MSRVNLQKNWIVILLLSIVGGLVFGLTTTFEALSYDDVAHIFDNSAVVTGNLHYLWHNIYFGMYIPVTYSVWSVYGQYISHTPGGFHFLNVLIHIVNSYLVFKVLLRLNCSREAALTGALLFLLHPVQVEPVAWISGFKDLLSFYFCAISIYLALSENKKIKIWALLFIILSLLSKPSSAPLPFFLLAVSYLLNYSKTEGVRLKSFVFENVHLILGSFFSILITLVLTQNQGQAEYEHPGLAERLIIVADSLGFYLSKIILPLENFPDYGRIPALVLNDRLYWGHLVITFVFLTAAAFYLLRKKRDSLKLKVEISLLFFLLFFIPTSGIVPFTFQDVSTTADRYLYFLILSLASIVAVLVDHFRLSRKLVIIIAAAIAIVLGMTSHNQALIWRNNETLFTEMIEGNPNSYLGFQDLAAYYEVKDEFSKAIALYKKANSIRPSRMAPIAGLISVYYKTKKWTELDTLAETYLNEPRLKTMVDSGTATGIAFGNYAYSLLERNRKLEALTAFCKAGRHSKRAEWATSKITTQLKQDLNLKDLTCD